MKPGKKSKRAKNKRISNNINLSSDNNYEDDEENYEEYEDQTLSPTFEPFTENTLISISDAGLIKGKEKPNVTPGLSPQKEQKSSYNENAKTHQTIGQSIKEGIKSFLSEQEKLKASIDDIEKEINHTKNNIDTIKKKFIDSLKPTEIKKNEIQLKDTLDALIILDLQLTEKLEEKSKLMKDFQEIKSIKRSISSLVAETDNRDVLLCMICLDKPGNSIFAPCGHKCTCPAHAEEIKKRDGVCPICKTKIESLVKKIFT